MTEMVAKTCVCTLSTHDPETIHWNFGVKVPDAVLPPAQRLGVGKVGKGGGAGPNLQPQF